MKKIDQVYSCKLPGQVFGVWNFRGQLRIYEPHPEQQTILISNFLLENGWFVPFQVECLATLIVKEFHLNPEIVVFVEHYSKKHKKNPSGEFRLISFNWQGERATYSTEVSIACDQVSTLIGELLDPLFSLQSQAL